MTIEGSVGETKPCIIELEKKGATKRGVKVICVLKTNVGVLNGALRNDSVKRGIKLMTV